MPELEVSEGLQHQASGEQIIYTLDVGNYPGSGSPTSITVTVYNLSSGTDVTATVTSGSASVSGTVITLPTLKSLSAGTTYRVQVKFTRSGSIFEPHFNVKCLY